MNNGTIISQVGTRQSLYKSGATCSYTDVDYIKNIIMFNSPELSKDGLSGRIRFNDANGKIVQQLSLSNGVSRLLFEDKSVILISGLGAVDGISSYAYYGTESLLEFESASKEYQLGSVEGYVDALKAFYNAWKVKKGSIGAVVVAVDNVDVFNAISRDIFFEECYLLMVV